MARGDIDARAPIRPRCATRLVPARPSSIMRRLLVIAFLLAFAGGYADAASYVLTKSFTGHLTGNTVFLCLHLTQGAWREAASNALAIAAFVAGVAGAEWLGTGSGKPARARQLVGPLLIEGALLLIAAGFRWQPVLLGNDLTVVFLCLGLGWQNGALRKCGAMSIHTTFITGMSTTLVTAVFQRASGEEPPDDQKKHPPAVLAAMLLTFAAGAVAGGWLDLPFQGMGVHRHFRAVRRRPPGRSPRLNAGHPSRAVHCSAGCLRGTPPVVGQAPRLPRVDAPAWRQAGRLPYKTTTLNQHVKRCPSLPSGTMPSGTGGRSATSACVRHAALD